MRYFDLTLSLESGGLHPVDRTLAGEAEVTRDSLLDIAAFGDGTGVLLYRLVGDAERAVAVVDSRDDVRGVDLIDAADDAFHLYLHVGPGEPAGTLMAICDEYALIVETPIKFTERGDVVLTVVGRHDVLRGALRDAPAAVDVSVEQAGEYHPDERNLLSRLTDRQHEVFETAVERGYYEIPRNVTQEELAAILDCAPSTVDEHLRKAESKMLSSVARAPGAR